MAYDYSKLKGKIIEKYGTQTKFAEAIGLSERSLSLKMTNERNFKQKEITKACELLALKDEDVSEYFFTLKVQ